MEEMLILLVIIGAVASLISIYIESDYNKEKIVQDLVNSAETIDLVPERNIPGCPVIIEKLQILMIDSKPYIRTYFKNKSDKIISGVSYYLSCYDSFGESYGDVKAIIQDQNVIPEQLFGFKNMESFIIPHHATRKVEVFIDKVGFKDGTTWSLTEEITNKLIENAKNYSIE